MADKLISATLAQLRCFLALAETGSFQHTADRLGRSQPAVSAQIRNLEDILGFRLLHRTTRKVTLTREGRALLPGLRSTLADLDALLAEAHRLVDLQSGQVRMGAAPTLAVHILPAVVRSFRLRFPGVRVILSDENTPRLEEMVLAGELDMYIGPRPPALSPLLFDPIAEDDYLVLVPGDHPLSGYTTLKVGDLESSDWLMMKEGTSMRRETGRFLERHGLKVRVVEEVANHFTLGGMVAAGCGITILPRTAIALAALPGVSAIPLADARLTRELGIATRADHIHGPAAKALLGIAVPLVRTHCRPAGSGWP